MPATVSLLSTDTANSVLHGLPPAPLAAAYTVYGASTSLPWRAAFNGQPCELASELYMLGNGYRGYSPLLRRFYSPDSLSPFGEGGLNAYAYCVGDPINWVDPSGNAPLSTLLKLLRRIPGARKLLARLGRGRVAARAGSYTSLKSSQSAGSAVNATGPANALPSGGSVIPPPMKGSELVTTKVARGAEKLPVDNTYVPILRSSTGSIELAAPPVNRAIKPGPAINRALKPHIPASLATEPTHVNLDVFHRRVAAGAVIQKAPAPLPRVDQVRKPHI